MMFSVMSSAGDQIIDAVHLILKFVFFLRLIALLCLSSLGQYMLDSMNKFHGLNFHMLLMIMEASSLLRIITHIAHHNLLCLLINNFSCSQMYADIFFEIYDNENLLKDPGARNPVVSYRCSLVS